MFPNVRNFDLVLLEEGEEYVSDIACTHVSSFPGQVTGRSIDVILSSLSGLQREDHVRGRLRVGTKSVIFEPDDCELELLKLRFLHIDSICDSNRLSRSILIFCRRVISVPTIVYNGKTRFVTPYGIHDAECSERKDSSSADSSQLDSNQPHFLFLFTLATKELKDSYLTLVRKLWSSSIKNDIYTCNSPDRKSVV